MTIKKGLVISRDGNSSLVQFATDCKTCTACPQNPTQAIQLPGQFDSEVTIQLGLRDQLFLLFNSLGIPVLLAIFGAFIANLLQANELIGIILSVCCFSLGMLLCRRINPAVLQIKESN